MLVESPVQHFLVSQIVALFNVTLIWINKTKPELKQCLDDIKKADQTLADDARFVRLNQLIYKNGII